MSLVSRLYDMVNDAITEQDDVVARDSIARIAQEIGVDLFTDVQGGSPWSHSNLHRVVVAVQSMRFQLAQSKGFDSFVRRTDTVEMPAIR